MHTVVLCQDSDRATGLVKALAGLWPDLKDDPVRGREVLIKPNYNTADPAPGSSDNATILALVDELWRRGARTIRLGERSWRDTREVLRSKGIVPELAKRQVEVMVFDELPARDWVEFKVPGHHWPQGFAVFRPMLEAECLVEACCLKTHQYGGGFTMSLKLAVGAVPGAAQGAAYMNALHSSPRQQSMIAEINTAFAPDIIVMDAVEAFTDGGPMEGRRQKGEATLAAANRVAMDAAGLACLKRLGSNRLVMATPIWEQEQIKRAVELGLGPAEPGLVRLKPADEKSRAYAREVADILARG